MVVQDVPEKYNLKRPRHETAPAWPAQRDQVDHSPDAYDTIAWFMKNVPESNWKIGTIGTTYDGFATLMSVVNPHPARKAAVPIDQMVGMYPEIAKGNVARPGRPECLHVYVGPDPCASQRRLGGGRTDDLLRAAGPRRRTTPWCGAGSN